jgi:hypothetical protein
LEQIMTKKRILFGFIIVVWATPVLADDLLNKVEAAMTATYSFLGSAKLSAEGTRVFYFKGQNDTFSVTCTTLAEGGWYCARGSANTAAPLPFVVH